MIERLLHALTSARFSSLDEAEPQTAVARLLDDSKINDIAKAVIARRERKVQLKMGTEAVA